jgi:hypothetical protein
VQKRAAELLHIKPTTLNEMIKRHDIRPRRKRGPAASRADVSPDTPEGSEPHGMSEEAVSDEGVNDEGEEVGVD